MMTTTQRTVQTTIQKSNAAGLGRILSAGTLWAWAGMSALLTFGGVVGCDSEPNGGLGPGAGDMPDAGAPDGAPAATHGCSDIFAAGVFPTFDITVSDADWAMMLEEHGARAGGGAADPAEETWRPAVFRYGTEEFPNASIRLKGSAWAWDKSKMHFVVAFHRAQPDDRFRGLRQIELDATPYDPSFLRNRLALSYLRDLGLPASCANSARININGVYYGLFTSIEAVDEQFVSRNFPDATGGDLWMHGWKPANLATARLDRRDQLFATVDVDGLDALADLDQAIAE